MQIAAINPEFLDEKDVPEDRLNKEKEILKAQVINEGRPEAIAEKIVMGRLGKFYEEICLVDQAFIKDPSKKVKDVLKYADKVTEPCYKACKWVKNNSYDKVVDFIKSKKS